MFKFLKDIKILKNWAQKINYHVFNKKYDDEDLNNLNDETKADWYELEEKVIELEKKLNAILDTETVARKVGRCDSWHGREEAILVEKHTIKPECLPEPKKKKVIRNNQS